MFLKCIPAGNLYSSIFQILWANGNSNGETLHFIFGKLPAGGIVRFVDTGAAEGAQGGGDFFAVLGFVHVNEVNDDDAADVAQAQLARHFPTGVEVGLEDGLLEAARAGESGRGFAVVADDVPLGLDFGVLEQWSITRSAYVAGPSWMAPVVA